MKKGFTLIELLAAITILALLALVAIPAVTNQTNTSKTTLYNVQLKNIESAARAWGAENIFLIQNDKCVTLTLGYLKDLGLIDVKVENPLTGKDFDDDNTFVNITKNGNRYKYEVKLDEDKCSLIDDAIKSAENTSESNEEIS